VNCQFYDTAKVTWDNTSCTLLNSTDTESFCACSHLTEFSVFMPPNIDLPAIVITADNYATLAFLCAVGALYILVMGLVLGTRFPPVYWRALRWLDSRALLARRVRPELRGLLVRAGQTLLRWGRV
jgi:hypothetical protein